MKLVWILQLEKGGGWAVATQKNMDQTDVPCFWFCSQAGHEAMATVVPDVRECVGESDVGQMQA
jgi:hypothetical protein